MGIGFVSDIGCDNDYFVHRFDTDYALSAVVWKVLNDGDMQQARIQALQQCLASLSLSLKTSRFYLLLGDPSATPVNRIVRYYGFWRALERASIYPPGRILGEYEKEQEDGVRYFTATDFELSQVELVHTLMRGRDHAIVASLGTNTEEVLHGLISDGWPKSSHGSAYTRRLPPDVVKAVCGSSGIVVELYGEFDDRNVVCAAIGKHEVIYPLFQTTLQFAEHSDDGL